MMVAASRRRSLLVAVVLLVLLAPLAALGGRKLRAVCESSPRFAITHVDVRGARRVAPEMIVRQAGIETGSNLFRVSPAAARARLLENPWIADAQVKRRLPGRVVVSVVEREPVASLFMQEWLAVSDDGTLLPLEFTRERFELPLIAGCFGTDGLDRDRLRRGAGFLSLVGDECSFLLRDVSEVNMTDPDDLVVYTVQSGTAVRFGSGGYRDKLGRLVPVLEDLSGNERIPASIDLRFRGQAVVQFRPPLQAVKAGA
jgi:cell division protein FtsQ